MRRKPQARGLCKYVRLSRKNQRRRLDRPGHGGKEKTRQRRCSHRTMAMKEQPNTGLVERLALVPSMWGKREQLGREPEALESDLSVEESMG